MRAPAAILRSEEARSQPRALYVMILPTSWHVARTQRTSTNPQWLLSVVPVYRCPENLALAEMPENCILLSSTYIPIDSKYQTLTLESKSTDSLARNQKRQRSRQLALCLINICSTCGAAQIPKYVIVCLVGLQSFGDSFMAGGCDSVGVGSVGLRVGF